MDQGKKTRKRPSFKSPFVNIKVNPDGTIKRPTWPRHPANPDPNSSSPVLSKDVVLNPSNKTWNRLYIPNPPPKNKLPLILFYHGGGFVFSNADTSIMDVFCQGLVKNVGAMVVSLDYRLAPEHRLPAAYDDAMDGLYWIQTTDDEWIVNYADLNNSYLFGSSAGANIVYHTGLRLCSKGHEVTKLKVRGLILNQPYFSGKKRTGSEEKLANDPLLPLSAIDQMFDLSLPEGTDRDHEYCNPFSGKGEWKANVDEMKRLGWRVMVAGCFDDPLMDAGMEFANVLERKGVEVVKFFGEGYHAMEIFQPSRAKPIYDAVKDFILKPGQIVTSKL